MKKNRKIKKLVREIYGNLAEESSSCCSDYSCCGIGYSIEEIKDLPSDVSEFSLGCGNPVALSEIREGEIILDIGSGGGLDVFLASKKVGPKGKVIGLDMTEEMVKRAKQNTKKGNHTNVEFKLGDAENIPLKNNSIDLVISNCVINLVPDKEKVYKEIYRILKPGGRFVISDIVVEKDLDKSVKDDPEKLVACVGGALTEKEYINIIKKVGFINVKTLKKIPLVLSGIKVWSETIKGEKGGK